MKSSFAFADGAIVLVTGGGPADILLYTSPDSGEKQDVLHTLSMDPHTLESALDADEISRVEFAADGLSIIWKQPKNISVEEQLRFEVGSMGLFLHQGRLIVILGEGGPSFTAREFQSCQSLICYINAIEANGGVLVKLEAHSQQFSLNPRQSETLHDLVVDNQQCARQARIYSDVVSGLMDARGTIINNNVSILLKKLTLISIIFLPLNLIASIGGMSEFSMMTQGVDWRLSYSLLGIGMLALGWGSWHALVRLLDRRRRK